MKGRFGDTSGCPYVEGRLYVPRLKVDLNISFLVDTGADYTVLMPADALVGGLDYKLLKKPIKVGGCNGTGTMYQELAWVTFPELGHRRLHLYKINLLIPGFRKDLEDTRSLLGRDILNRWQMSYNWSKKRLNFKILSSDAVVPIPRIK